VTTITDPTGARVQAASTADGTGIAATIDPLPLGWGQTFTNQELAQFVDTTGYGSTDTAYLNFGSGWVLGTVTLISSTTHTYSVTGSGTLPSGPSVSVGVSVQGTGVTSDVAASNDNAIAPPSTPTLYSTADNATSVTLHWTDTATDSRTGFQVEEQVDESWGGNFSLVPSYNVTMASLGSGVYSATVGGLMAGRNYTFRVRAVGVGESAYSGSLDVTPAPNPDLVPDAPTGLALASNLLSWNAVTSPVDAVDYDVQYRVGSSGDWQDLGPTEGSVSAYVPAPGAGQTFDYRVSAIGSDSIESVFSDILPVSSSVNPPLMPGPELTASWDAANNCFDVHYLINGGWDSAGKFDAVGGSFSIFQNGPNGMVRNVDISNTFLTPVSGAPAGNYHLNLGGDAFLDIGNGPFQLQGYASGVYDPTGESGGGGETSVTSSPVTATVTVPDTVTPPAAAANLTVAASTSTIPGMPFGNNSVTTYTLTWDDNADNETGYEIDISYDGTTWQTLADVGPDVSSYTYYSTGSPPGIGGGGSGAEADAAPLVSMSGMTGLLAPIFRVITLLADITSQPSNPANAHNAPVIVGLWGLDLPFHANGDNLQTPNALFKKDIDDAGGRSFQWDQERVSALPWLLKQLDTNGDGKYDPNNGDVRRTILIAGYSWGGWSAIALAQDIQNSNKFVDKSIALLATVDPVNILRGDPGPVPSNVQEYWNRYESDGNYSIAGLVTVNGFNPSSNAGGVDSVDDDPDGTKTTLGGVKIDHVSIMTDVESNNLNSLLKKYMN